MVRDDGGMASHAPTGRNYLPNSPFNAGRAAEVRPGDPIPVGERVCHERHGVGRVVTLEADTVVIDFGGGHLRRVALNSPRLERL